jgi:hypothetical protein
VELFLRRPDALVQEELFLIGKFLVHLLTNEIDGSLNLIITNGTILKEVIACRPQP